jgi:hypothetical protein
MTGLLLWGATCLSNIKYSWRYLSLLKNMNLKIIRNMPNSVCVTSGAMSLQKLVSIGFRFALNRRLGGPQRKSGSVGKKKSPAHRELSYDSFVIQPEA